MSDSPLWAGPASPEERALLELAFRYVGRIGTELIRECPGCFALTRNSEEHLARCDKAQIAMVLIAKGHR